MKRKLKNSELRRHTIADFKKIKKLPLVILLDNVRSLHNVGSVFRTADAFMIESVYLCGITASPPHREIHKTALGATDSVEWKYFKTSMEAIDTLKADNYTILAVEQCDDAQQLGSYKLERDLKYVLVFGNEINGVSNEVIEAADECIEIPQFGTKHSLNISVSVGVVVWDIIQSSDHLNKYSESEHLFESE